MLLESTVVAGQVDFRTALHHSKALQALFAARDTLDATVRVFVDMQQCAPVLQAVFPGVACFSSLVFSVCRDILSSVACLL
jgi:hypothetical protein